MAETTNIPPAPEAGTAMGAGEAALRAKAARNRAADLAAQAAGKKGVVEAVKSVAGKIQDGTAEVTNWVASAPQNRLWRRLGMTPGGIMAAAADVITKVGLLGSVAYILTSKWAQQLIAKVACAAGRAVRWSVDKVVDGTAWLLDKFGSPGKWLAKKLRGGRDRMWQAWDDVRDSNLRWGLQSILEHDTGHIRAVHAVARGSVFAGVLTMLMPGAVFVPALIGLAAVFWGPLSRSVLGWAQKRETVAPEVIEGSVVAAATPPVPPAPAPAPAPFVGRPNSSSAPMRRRNSNRPTPADVAAAARAVQPVPVS